MTQSSDLPAGIPLRWEFAEFLAQRDAAKILDFGCGYGRQVIELLQAGFDVWGVDVSETDVAKAAQTLRESGFDPARVSVLGADGRSAFPDESFDVIFSDQVLEHVADLDRAVAEIARLLKPGGLTLHQWPARWTRVEPHLQMPFIHWLPKNVLRRAAIHLWTRLGVRCEWPPELDRSAGWYQFAEFEYRYSVEQTFYRPARLIDATFQRHGLEPVRSRLYRRLPRPMQSAVLAARKAFKNAQLVARKRA